MEVNRHRGNSDYLELVRRHFVQQRELLGNEILMSAEEADSLLQALAGSQLTLSELREVIKDCQRCPLGKTRTHLVFGVGNEKADLMLIGEAPGEEEDLQGEPFVGRAGQLLNKILEAIGLRRQDVYIANILKCRPPGNRDPLPSEVEKCEPYLFKQIELIQPKLIVALGRVAGQTLLRTTTSLSQLRGKVHNFRGVKLIVTFHPAALLRNPQWKRPTWEDMQLVKKTLEVLIQKASK